MVRLSGLGGRKPVQLSGGQRQRVALARAIVNEPEVLLLDEPLGALDPKLRQEMQLELKRIQREVGITFVYVTHDQEEALTMSDRLAVFNQGRIEQLGTPVEVYEQPATDFVAGFIGISNLLERDGRHSRSGRRRSSCWPRASRRRRAAMSEQGRSTTSSTSAWSPATWSTLDAGGQLTAVRQNLDGDAADVAGRPRGTTITVAWRDDQTYEIVEPGHAGACGGGRKSHEEMDAGRSAARGAVRRGADGGLRILGRQRPAARRQLGRRGDGGPDPAAGGHGRAVLGRQGRGAS